MEDNHHAGDQNKAVETTDRGVFDFMKKDDDVTHNPENVEKEKLHRPNSSSSSSSDEEEEGVDGEKKKKKEKKGLKEKIKEKISGDKDSAEAEHKDTSIPAENPDEKKGFLENIKEKLPGQQKKAEDEHPHHPAEGEPKEKVSWRRSRRRSMDTRLKRIRLRKLEQVFKMCQ